MLSLFHGIYFHCQGQRVADTGNISDCVGLGGLRNLGLGFSVSGFSLMALRKISRYGAGAPGLRYQGDSGKGRDQGAAGPQEEWEIEPTAWRVLCLPNRLVVRYMVTTLCIPECLAGYSSLYTIGSQ